MRPRCVCLRRILVVAVAVGGDDDDDQGAEGGHAAAYVDGLRGPGQQRRTADTEVTSHDERNDLVDGLVERATPGLTRAERRAQHVDQRAVRR